MIDMLLLHCNTPTTQEYGVKLCCQTGRACDISSNSPEAIMIAFKLRFKVFFGASYVFLRPN